jgi:hypothetical protein
MLSVERIVQQVSSWSGVSQSPHRFGGVEFTLAGREVGHVHRNGMVDIPFNGVSVSGDPWSAAHDWAGGCRGRTQSHEFERGDAGSR